MIESIIYDFLKFCTIFHRMSKSVLAFTFILCELCFLFQSVGGAICPLWISSKKSVIPSIYTENPADPAYPLVKFPDQVPLIDSKTAKVYETTVGLQPVSINSRFNPTTFRKAALFYYDPPENPPLCGFEDVPLMQIQSKDVSPYLTLVTYNVSYNVEMLQATPNISDALVKNTIGNYQELQNNIGNPALDLSFYYTFEFNDENFKFSGKNSVCSEVICNGTYLFCTETLDGGTIKCKSFCKTEYCKNDGTCVHERPFQIPTCLCPSYRYWWYIGFYCENILVLWMLVLPAVVCLVAVLLVAFFAYCYYLSKKNKKIKELSSQKKSGNTNSVYLHNEAPVAKEESITNEEDNEKHENGYASTIDGNENLSGTSRRSSRSFNLRQRQISEASSSSQSLSKQSDPTDSWSLQKQGSERFPPKYESETPSMIYEEIGPISTTEKKNPNPCPNNERLVDIRLRPGWTPSLGPQLLKTQDYENV